jgi:hypothetical protein
LELRVSFKDNVILIELGVQGVDLALPECVIQRVINRLWSNSKARGGGTVNYQGSSHAAQLLVGYNVGKFR